MTMKLVPIQNSLVFALEETDGDTGIGTQMLHRWAKKAELEIGLQRMYRKIKLINPLKSNFIDPPDDAINIKYIYLGDMTSDITKNIDDTIVTGEDIDYDAMGGYVWTPLYNNYVRENMWDIQGGQLKFNTDLVGQILTMDYTAFPTNENFDIIVPEYHLDAISYYVQYRMARILRWKMMRDPKMMRANESMTIREMKQEWIKEKSKAKSIASQMTPYDKYKIDLYLAEMTGSFIHNFE